MAARHPARPWALSLLAVTVACGEPEGGGPEASAQGPNPDPPTARWGQVEQFRADLVAPRHPSDGKGTVRVTRAPDQVVAGGVGRWTFEFEVAETGIAPGGSIHFMPEPFWGWSTPQVQNPELPGFTNVAVSRPETVLSADTFGGQDSGLLILTVGGAGLEGGDLVTLDYGAGAAGARADRYAGRDARLWFSVDGDGDGIRAILPASPSVDVSPREPARVVVLGPSTARPGEPLRYHVSALDGWANRAPQVGGEPWTGSVELELLGPLRDRLPPPPPILLNEEGFAAFELSAPSPLESQPGPLPVLRVRATLTLPDGSTTTSVSNPLLVDAEAPRILWADLHGHTGRSDGTGAVEDYFLYARDTARLDVLALTDHDHFGPRFLDQVPKWQEEMREVTERFHVPGQLVTLHGYEWTSWIHGHRHVLRFDAGGPILSSMDPATDTPAELWSALEGEPAMTIAHHSSGNPIPVNWTYTPDPRLEPVTEVVSVHGSSEARDAPQVVSGSRDGWFVRDQLDRGLRLGFIGSGDSHDGHPGLPHLSPIYGWRAATARSGEVPGTGGLAAIFSPTFDRVGVLDALRRRAAYATSGPRIIALVERTPGRAGVVIRFHGTAPLDRIDLILGPALDGSAGSEVRPLRPGASGEERTLGPLDAAFEVELPETLNRSYFYLRLVQADRAAAWVGPWWRESPLSAAGQAERRSD